MKRIISVFLALVMIVAIIPVGVMAAKEGRITYHVVDGCAVIVAYENSTVDRSMVYIPDTLGGYPVTEIAESAFQGCGYVGYVLPDSITKIGKAAFKYCSGMKSITLPANITAIEDETFESCRDLTSIVIPDGVTSIGNKAFSWCTMLSDITIPDSVKSIGDYAFELCKISSFIPPKELESMGAFPFSGCRSLRSVVLPDFMTEIPDDYFSGCTTLKTVTLPDTVTKIGDDVFGTTRLESIVIPPLVTEINDNMFNGCKYLTTVTMQDGVTRIGDYAFNGCTVLENVDIPASVTEIGENPFGGTAVTEFSVSGENPVYSVVDGNITSKDGKTLFHYPAANDRTEYTVPEGTETVSDLAFCGAANLKSITLPDGVTKLGYAVFSGCKNLTKLYVPATVTDIDNGVFDGMNSAVYSLIVYGEKGSAIESCTFRAGAAFIAFDDITEESEKFKYTIYTGYAIIDGYNGEYPDNLVIPDTICGYPVYSIADRAFENGTFKTVVLPENLSEIGEYAFYKCASLEDVTVNQGLETIGESAFSWCTSLKTFDIPDSMTKIEESVFLGCSTLNEVRIPDSITTIHSYAFLGSEYVSIFCREGSYAEQFAKYYDIPYRVSEDIPVPTPPYYERGDIDQNHKINLTDVSLLLKYIAGWSFAFEDKDADTNGDGKINLSDVSLLLKYIAGWNVQFAPLDA